MTSIRKRQPIAFVRAGLLVGIARRAVLIVLLAAGAILPAQQNSIAAQQSPAAASSVSRLTLAQAVEMALQHNRRLVLAQQAIRDTKEQKDIAQSHFYPKLSNESSVLHITELEGVVIPAGAFAHGGNTGLIPAQTLRLDQGASTTYTSGTGLAQPITQAFKIRAGVKAAEADVNSAKVTSDDAENGIALEVHQLYFEILIEQTRAEAAHDAVEAADVVEQENSRGLAEGRLLADAELQSRADLLDKQESALVSNLTLNDLMLQLDDAIGAPLGTKFALDADSVGGPPVVPARADAMALVRERSPKVLEARAAVEKAKAGLAAARDEYIPDLTGIARYSYQDGLPFFARNFGSFGARFSYDLFDGGAREAALRDARIKVSMAQTALEQAEDDAVLAVSATYDKVEQFVQLLGVAQQALEARQEALRIKTSRAEATAELPSSVATARAAVTAARMSVLNARLNLYLAQNSVQRLLGQRPN